MRESKLEIEMSYQIRLAGLRPPQREFYAIPGRQFRFDFAWEEEKLLVEIQGGTFSKAKMAHNSGLGIERDNEKRNLATLLGWRVLSIGEKPLKDGRGLRWIQEALSQSPIERDSTAGYQRRLI